MFAVVELSGKQYLVKEKDKLRIEKTGEVGKDLTNTSVLLVNNGNSTKIGSPYVSGASVEFKVLAQGKDEKVRIFKMKSKKRYRRLRGFRATYSDLEVTKIHA